MFEWIKKRYHYVYPCPRCGSNKTGYVTKARSEELRGKLAYEGILNGELVEAELGTVFDDENNLFCRDCGARWYGEVEIKYLTLEERMQQRELRGINEEMIDEYSILSLNRFERKQAVKIINKEKKKVQKIKTKQATKQTVQPQSKIKIKK